jgi:hypothetical protein
MSLGYLIEEYVKLMYKQLNTNEIRISFMCVLMVGWTQSLDLIVIGIAS